MSEAGATAPRIFCDLETGVESNHLGGKVINLAGVWALMVCMPEWWLHNQVVLLGVDSGCLDGRKVGSLYVQPRAGVHGSIGSVYSQFSL